MQVYVDRAQDRPIPTEFEELLETISSTRDNYDEFGSLEIFTDDDDETVSDHGNIKALVSTQCAAKLHRTQHSCSQSDLGLGLPAALSARTLICGTVATLCLHEQRA